MFYDIINKTIYFTYPIIVFVLFFVVRWIFLIPKKDLIETSETTLKIGFALFITLIYFISLCYHGIFLFIKSDYSVGYKVNFFIEIIVFLITVFPLIYLCINYLNLNKFFKKKFGLAGKKTQPLDEKKEKIKIFIERISDELGLKKKPEILFSTYKNILPCVFGKSSKNTFISLPINWDEIFQKVSQNNKKIEQNLKRFVILHELSHIKHRDHVFIGWSFLFLKSFKYWILAVILTASMLSYIIGLSKIKLLFGPIIWGIVYYLILYLITQSVSRNREYLADARASLFMSAQELESIFEPEAEFKGRRMSYLESLFHRLSISAELKTNAIGISGTQKWLERSLETGLKKVKSVKARERIYVFLRSLHKIFCTHPKKELRPKKLKEKHFIEMSQIIVSKESAVWIGMLLSLFYSIVFIYPLQISALIPYDYELWRVLLQGRYYDLYFISRISIFILLYIPLRNAFKIVIPYKKYLCALVFRLLIIFSTFFVITFLLNSILYLNDEIYVHNKFSDIINLIILDYRFLFPFAIAFMFLLTSDLLTWAIFP